jgi:general L-amino acid transport system permease protein
MYCFWQFWDWAVVHATWNANNARECSPQGACWAVIRVRYDQFIYGFYPQEQRWRVNMALALVGLGVTLLLGMKMAMRLKVLMTIFLALGIIFLLHGGAGLLTVATDLWGGLFVTIVLALGSMLCAFPIAILLALGRSSRMVVVKGICITFIELVRGVPLISVLFLASVMLPLFFQDELNLDKLLRAFIGITLFQAAYLAEVVRGGLNSVPVGQKEAAFALGLSYWQTMLLVILPQALRVAIPGIVNSTIAIFKDTSLIYIIGLYDFLGMVQSATTDPHWLGTALEAYLFCAVVYWIFCFGMSLYSKQLEQRLKVKFN